MLGESLTFLIDALVQPFAAVLLFRFHAVWLQGADAQPDRRIPHGAHRFCRVARAPFRSAGLGAG